jgi:hypothetical protein
MNNISKQRSRSQARTALSYIMLACLVGIIAGCGSSAESHDDDHLEHFVPAHKPKDFEDLVHQLALRVSQLAEDGQPSGGHDQQRAAAIQEFTDIIGWIPELAADSELLKADFEAAVATGNKLNAAFLESRKREKAGSVDMTTMAPLIDELRTLVPQSQPRKEQM